MPYYIHGSVAHLDLHSFPTRRSSDLIFWPNACRSFAYFVDSSRARWAIPRACAAMPIRPPSRVAAQALGIAQRRSEEHTSELQSPYDLVCRLLLEKKKKHKNKNQLHM